MKDQVTRKQLLLAVFALIFTSVVQAVSTANEFIIKAENYDKLSEHNFNCTFAVDETLAVSWCSDGYFAIDDMDDLINPSTAFKVQANLTVELESEPKDIRLDTYLSMTEYAGEKLTVIKRSSMEALHIELDRSNAPGSIVLGGFFSPDFVVFQILNEQQTFLQVHTSKQSLGVVATIDNDVINYDVLDLAQTKNLFYVFATQQLTASQRQIAMIQIPYSDTEAKWLSPSLVTYDLDPLQCSDKLKVTESIVVLTCKSTNTITILRRSNMQQIYQQQYSAGVYLFEQLFIISHKEGRQSYVFYSMSTNQAHRVGMLEVLIDEAKTNEEQLIMDRGELNVPDNSDDPSNNDGPINLGGGSKYLLATFESFNQIKGYTMCAYDQVLQNEGSTICSPLETETKFTLNPFDTTVTECGQEVLGTDEQKKLAFLCIEEETESMDIFMLAVLITLGFGGLCCCASFCVFCKYRAKANNAIDDANLIVDRVHDPVAAQRMLEQQNKQKLTLIAKVLPRKKFSQTKFKENQESCAICVEDFQSSTMIRETPCKHIFHDHCVMKWIETKLQQPDCPFCRAEISISSQNTR